MFDLNIKRLTYFWYVFNTAHLPGKHFFVFQHYYVYPRHFLHLMPPLLFGSWVEFIMECQVRKRKDFNLSTTRIRICKYCFWHYYFINIIPTPISPVTICKCFSVHNKHCLHLLPKLCLHHFTSFPSFHCCLKYETKWNRYREILIEEG